MNAEPARKQIASLDERLAAVNKILSALKGLDVNNQNRVLQAVAALLGLRLPVDQAYKDGYDTGRQHGEAASSARQEVAP